MIPAACPAPVSFERLADWLAGDLDAPAADAVEEHVFGCAGCARRAEAVGALRDGIRGAARRGWRGFLLPSIVERLERDGLRLHTYRLRSGVPVPCSVEPEDDLMIGRLEADLAGVERLDVEIAAGADVMGAARFEDVPVDRRAGEVILCVPAAVARPLPAHQMRVRLVAVQGGADRELGQYVFDHSPLGPRP